MKLSNSLVLTAVVVSSANAFSVVSRPNRVATTSRIAMSDDAADDVVAKSAMPEEDPYKAMGITKDELALGIDADEFRQWIGTKQELMEKFQRDNKGMTEETADEEVSKFLMDTEMANAYIKFEREKVESPPNLKEEAEQNFSDPQTIATYAAWLIGGAGFGYVRKEFIEPKFASGEWEEIHIGLPDFFGKSDEAAEAVNTVASAGEAASDAMHSVLESVANTMV